MFCGSCSLYLTPSSAYRTSRVVKALQTLWLFVQWDHPSETRFTNGGMRKAVLVWTAPRAAPCCRASLKETVREASFVELLGRQIDSVWSVQHVSVKHRQLLNTVHCSPGKLLLLFAGWNFILFAIIKQLCWFKREVTEEVGVVVTPYIRVLEVLGSNLGRDNGYSKVSLPFPPGSRQMLG